MCRIPSRSPSRPFECVISEGKLVVLVLTVIDLTDVLLAE
jgi:hypothetical protein